MNGKLNDKTSENLSVEMLNPFVHHLELKTTYEKIRTAIFTVILLPIRVAIICMLLVAAWSLACIGLIGISEQELRDRPLTGWRRAIRPILCYLGGMTYAVGGMNIEFRGKQATRKEAPILVAAPHSTFLDGGLVYITGMPTIIVRCESGSNPYIGKLLNYTQPVYVWRDDPNSRQNTIKEIIDRATSDEDWPQILVFPEGTCTNRSCLITFKPGAFYPGVPVQPVCIRYPNKLDTVTWTWDGPGALKLLWLTLTQMHSSCIIEFLPVYTPNEAEKKDPKLFASNVRAVMAKALGIPVSDYTYDDCRVITRAKQMNLPWAAGLVEAQKFRQKLGLDTSNAEVKILNSPHILCKDCSQLSYPEFANMLQIPMNNVVSQQLFRLYDKKNTGVIDFREYLYSVLVISQAEKTLDMIEIAFKIFDHSGSGRLSRHEFIEVMKHSLHIYDDDAIGIFYQITKDENATITFDQFAKYAENRSEYAYLFNTQVPRECKPSTDHHQHQQNLIKKIE
ncbi:lysophosphatidylcholine acyltransferase isoform X2 [Chrysoperla carnea]|uniref:lysophosphatidylcholine acyltransferase isoform X2 n=1 Tax=Chrysoperla carnea TaxID=189513 RepID=UPI001D078A9F|nr:lysophosphatidylcholine acyltransferase isoform X2 [Chrysoperla carnea]